MKKKLISLIGLLVLGLCVVSINGECAKDSVPCRTGEPECVTVKQQKDGRIDCKDGSDEGCIEGWFICKDRKSCIDPIKVQDGVPDCADASDEECSPLQHRCICAPHRCIDAENLKDGIKDCEDGSDEVEEIDIKSDCSKLVNSTSPVVRSKRRATDVSTRVDGPVTTSMFLGTENTAVDTGIRTRPTGLLTSTVGTFIQQGTTTEFATKVFGTHVDGHYAKIISTSSRVFFAIPSPAAGDALGGVRPTGLISSVTATRVSGLATTLHTTDYYRTYIDGTYAQLVSSYSRVVYPSTHTILATNAYNSIQSGQIYQTALNVLNEAERHIIDVSPINSKPIDKIIASKASNLIKPTNSYKSNEHVSVVLGDSKFVPAAANEDVVTVTGTRAAFVNSPAGNAETTYNVFTGTYIRDSKTYLFFFGNSADQYSPSLVNVVHATSIPEPQELVIKSGTIPGKRVVVNVDRELNLVVPKQVTSHAVAGSGEIEGQDVGGVFIEGSEDLSGFSVHGAQRSRNNVATEMLTVTIGKNVAHTKVLRDHSLQPSAVKASDKTVFKFLPFRDRVRQGSSSRVTTSTSHHVEEENENLLKARKIDFRPSKPRINLPTYTVGHVDYEHGLPATHEDTTELVVNINKSVEAFIGSRPRKDFKFLATSNRPRPGKSFRNFQVIHDKEDLQHVESQISTVTYVGFADFTTTVGNTVIVFMPHTKASQQPKSIATNLKVTKLSDAILPTVSTGSQTETTRMMTKIKTLFSNSPGMVTKTVTGHTLKMQTSLPTMLVSAVRKEKELSASVPTDIIKKPTDYEDMRSNVLRKEQVEASHVIDAELSLDLQLSSLDIEPSISFDDNYSEVIASIAELEISSSEIFENLQSDLHEVSSVKPTLPLTFATTETKLFNTINQFPIGLVKSVGGTEAYNGTTTIFTSLFYGTRIEGKYAQIIQTTSSIYFQPLIDATESMDIPKSEMTITTEESIHSTTEANTDSTTEGTTVELFGTTISDSSAENELGNEVDTARRIPSNLNIQIIEDKPQLDSSIHKEISAVPTKETSTIQYVTKVIPSTVYKTYTYFTTFFIPDGEQTSTSIQSREVTSSEISLSTSLVDIREILATAVANLQQKTSTTAYVNDETTTEENTITTNITPEVMTQDTTYNEISTQPTTPLPENEQEEIELIFKTQYTTYTYLTTFFHDKSSSIASREEVVTNIITSTLDAGSFASDPAVAGLFAREDSIVSAPRDNLPTSVGVGRPTTKFFSEMDENSIKPTARLAPSDSEPFTIQDQPDNAMKTYYTTYTYFTTIFVDGETTVSSRTEIYTNVITPTSVPSTGTQSTIAVTRLPLDKSEVIGIDEDIIATKSAKAIENENYANKYSTAIRSKFQKENIDLLQEATTPQNAITTPDLLTASSDTQTTAEISEVTTEASTGETSTESSSNNLVTQELPSGPTGPSGLDDQISLESNTDIDPSPTLLLQTSYTTFTYFTTLYKGSTSEIISRLETVTNIATETISPISASVLPGAKVENNELDATSVQELYPITYFTTFTYWTTAYKDGDTVVTSREETVSNVVTPTADTTEEEISTVAKKIEPSKIIATPTPTLDLQPTTFYTTFTYFTTSYVGESTVINSRLETVTNIVTPSVIDNGISPSQTGRAIGNVAPSEQLIESSVVTPTASPVLLPTGLISTIRSTTVNDGTTTLLSTDVYGTYIDGLYAKVLESSTQVLTPITPAPSVTVQPTGVVSLNIGSIVDVEGITTTYYTTKAIGTYIGNLYAQVVESTTSLYVDPERTPEPVVPSRTGLVRLIEGSIEKDGITTSYESRVIGTVVDGKYAQIIESTSHFKTGIVPSTSSSVTVDATQLVATSTPILESSLGETSGQDEDHSEEHEDDEEEEEEEDDDSSLSGGKGRVKSRLTFQSRKRTFTPVIRPFASRNRPTFNPRRRQTSATTITRTTLTPTVTATPASAPGVETTPFSRGRFNNRRVSSSSIVHSSSGEVKPTSSRKFSRGRGSTSGGFSPSSSSGYNSVPARRSSSGRISPTQTSAYPFGSSSRRGGSFSGRNAYSTPGRSGSSLDNHSTRGASIVGASSRFRIRPTSSLSFLGRSTSSVTPASADIYDNALHEVDNDVTDSRTEQEGQNTDFTDTTLNESPTTVTEATNFKRPPPFKLRRPPVPTRAPTTSTTSAPRTTSAARRFSLRRPNSSRISEDENIENKKTDRPKFRATSTTPVPPRSRVTRPNGPQTLRQRPTSNLFPPRGLFRRPGDDDGKTDEEVKSDEEKLLDEPLADSHPAEEEELGDNDYEASEPVEKSVDRKEIPKIHIRPFQSRLLRRSRRQTEYGNRGGSPSRTLASRLRRPTPQRKAVVVEEDTDDYESDIVTPAPRYSGRTRASQTSSAPRVRPTAASPRSQFTLTNNNNRSPQSSFKRTTTSAPTTSRRRRPEPESSRTTLQRPKPPRLRTQTKPETVSSRNSSGRRLNTATTNRGRGTTTRGRFRDFDYAEVPYSPSTFDGTITVTHKVPTEVTIPVVNGKITEYKQVIRNTPSTEVLRPDQYTSTEISGSQVLIINSEITATPTPGITEVTQFILRETPTTSVTFTPTNIRGRKTSFSHIVPSTVYEVENVVNTISDSLNPSAPLANLLLSQLLLGNFGIQQNLNPLLALNQQASPATPTTEYKTRSTTYVTTVTDSKSTVIPITLRGKLIMTTIIESSVDVITATEYVTETIVVTPTQSPNNQINSLLLPALLQAQLAGQQVQTQQQNPLIQLQQAQQLQQLQQQQQLLNLKSTVKSKDNTQSKQIHEDDLEEEDPRLTRDSEFDVISKEEISQANTRTQPSARKKHKFHPVEKPKQTSIITLYVSGRNPGEFSTVLSTVVSEAGASLVKREAITPAFVEIKPSEILYDIKPNQELDLFIMSAMNDIESSEMESSQETQSLESIIGDITKHFDTSITVSSSSLNPSTASSKTSTTQTGHFLFQGSVELAPLKRKARSTQNRGNIDIIPSLVNGNNTSRKRVLIRIPRFRDSNTNLHKKDLLLAEAQHSGFSKYKNATVTVNQVLHDTNSNINFSNVENPKNHTKRKRVLVSKRKRTDLLDENLETILPTFQIIPNLSTEASSTQGRRKKIVTLKRPIETINVHTTSTRHRITITKKRPVDKIDSTTKKQDLPVIKTTAFLNQLSTTSFLPSSTLEVEVKANTDSVHLYSTNETQQISIPVIESSFNFIANESKTLDTNKNTYIESSIITTPLLTDILLEQTTYEGPKFVRPTRFSVTHKPSDAFLKRIKSLRTNAKAHLPSRFFGKSFSSSTLASSILASTSIPKLHDKLTTENLNKQSKQIIHINNIISNTHILEGKIDNTDITKTASTVVEVYTIRTETQILPKTYTHVVTRVNGNERVVSTTLEVKSLLTTLKYTELVRPTTASAVVISTPVVSVNDANDSSGRGIGGRIIFEEARMNLATRIMNNGVEVIVADRSALPSEVLRIAPTTQKSLLAPSTISEQMLSLLPENELQASLISSLRSNTAHFVTKTYATTFTYLTTFVKGGKTATNSREEVVYNRVAENANQESIAPTKTINHFTIKTGYDKPSYDTNVYHTTYTYLNTIVDGDVPVVLTSKETISNTITEILEPTQLLPSEQLFETNTYFNTLTFTKSLKNENGGLFTSKHRNIVTQVVITEAPTFNGRHSETIKPTVRPTATTDIVKTYFVTYTYFNTFLEKGSTVIKTNIATSSDVVTEKFYLSPKRTPLPESTKVTAVIGIAPTSIEPFNVFATKTYLTTFTYFTTLLQGKNTVTSSSTKLVLNVVTEAITSGLDSLYLDSLRSSFAAQTSHEPITTTVMLAGEALEITAIQPTSSSQSIQNTAVSTLSPSFEHVVTGSTIIFLEDETTTATNKYTTKTTTPSTQVFTGASTVFIPEKNILNNTDTPEFLLSNLESNLATTLKPEFLTSTISASTVIKNSNGPATTLVPGDKVVLLTRPDGNVTMIPVSDPVKKRPNKDEDEDDEDEEDADSDEGDLKVPGLSGSDGSLAAEIGVSDLLNFGQLGINGLNALGPVINAMAGLIQSNLNTGQSKRNVSTETPIRNTNTQVPHFIHPKTPNNKPQISAQREPVYIPVGSLANNAHLSSEKHVPGFSESVRPDLPEDNENAGTSWVDSLPIQGEVVERIPLMDRPPQSQIILGRPTMESPLLQDGISIQPGQVITANSDVIVGKPSVLGPRPRPTQNLPIPPVDLRIPLNRPNEVHHPQIPNEIHGHTLPNNYPSKPSLPKGAANNKHTSNTPIGMRPPPLPQPHLQQQINHQQQNLQQPAHHVTHVSSPNNPQLIFVGNRYPQTHVNVGSNQHHPNNQNLKPFIQPTFVKNNIERSTGTIRPSKPIVIQGASTQFFGNDGKPIVNDFSYNDNVPIPLPEPGFIGVSNIGVSDQHIHVHHHHYDNSKDHIVVGTVGEPPAGPQHLGEVILEIPDTMPVLQPGSKLNFPVSSEQESVGTGQSSEIFYNRPSNENPQSSGQVYRPQNEVHNVHRIPFENNKNNPRPVYRPQNENLNIHVQQSVPVQRPVYEKNPPFIRPPFDIQRHPSAPSFEQTPIDMKPPPIPNNNDGSQNGQRPSQFSVQHSQNIYLENQNHNRPSQTAAPIVIPFNQHVNSNDQKRPDDVIISPIIKWENIEDPDEPEIEEGEKEGEVIQESIDHPLRPYEIPPAIVSERPSITDNDNEDLSAKRPNFNRVRVTIAPEYNNFKDSEVFSGNRPHFNLPESDIITRRPSLTFINQGIVVPEVSDIVTARPSGSSHNPLFTKHDEAADTERPAFILNNEGFEFESQGNTPRPFIIRPPRPPTSEKPPPLPLPDQEMNPPPPPPTISNQNNKQNAYSGPPKKQQRFPVIEVNLQDSTHRPTIGQRPQRPKPSSPYQYEIPERDVKPPPFPTPQRPTPFRPPNFNKDRNPEVSESSLISSQVTESVEETVPAQRPTLRPRPTRPTPRPSVRTSRPSNTLNSRPVRLPPHNVLEPPSPPPNIEPQTPVMKATISSIENENSFSTSNDYSAESVRPTKTVTIFETVLETESTQTIRLTPSRSSYKHRTRPTVKRPTIISSPIEIESSQVLWPENTEIEYTPTITQTVEITSSRSNVPSKSNVVLGAGVFARPKPSSTLRQYSSIEREKVESIAIKPVTSVLTAPLSPTTRFVTHTETHTVTATETTVLRSRGHPITRTVILTQTEAPRTVVSTIIGTITEIHTLDARTITTTISATVTTKEVEIITTIYPQVPQYDTENFPSFTVRPEDSLPPKKINVLSSEDNDRNDHGHDINDGLELDTDELNTDNKALDQPFSVDQRPSVPAICQPECDVNKNELCQERDDTLRCICRPGFARIFPDRPCNPTYTYRLKLLLDKEGNNRLRFLPTLSDAASPEFRRLSDAAREGVKRAAMRSELRDMFHGAAVTGFEPKQRAKDSDDLDQADDLMLNFYLQLSENMDESALEEKFQRSLQSTNYSLGGTEVFAARETGIQAFDFDECSSPDFNDCAEHAQCFNLRGTYTCSCNEGYSDLSPSSKFPGRACSAELLGCEQCNFHGTCYTLGRGDNKQYCDCFQWYAGDNCNINLKALLIALVTLGAVMLMLLLVCLILTCLKKRRNNNEGPGPGFMRYRGPGGVQVRGTLDKAAMLQDTSSESSGTTSPLPYMTPVHPSGSKGGRRGVNMDPSMVVHGEGNYVLEQDRSLTVMIPRAKYRPVPPASSVLSMSTFAAPDATRQTGGGGGVGGGSPNSQSEQKLLNYLESGGSPDKQNSGGKRKQSSSSAVHPEHSRKTSAPRRPSAGALVSAGFEVSAQVTRAAPRRASQPDHLTLASHRSGFTTLRTGDSDIEKTPRSMEDISTIPIPPPPPPMTVSEARSYDETLVQPPTRSLMMRGGQLQPSSTYGSKLGSSRNDGQTMAERDIGSTFVMPQSQLYKPARGQGSDVSNFDSL